MTYNQQPLDPLHATRRVRELAQAGRVKFTLHAQENRGDWEHDLDYEDVMQALRKGRIKDPAEPSIFGDPMYRVEWRCPDQEVTLVIPIVFYTDAVLIDWVQVITRFKRG